MLIFYDCGNNCPDAHGFRCFFGKDIYNGISNRQYQEDLLFGVCSGAVERIKLSPLKQCKLPKDFFIHYMAKFPSATCKAETSEPLQDA